MTRRTLILKRGPSLDAHRPECAHVGCKLPSQVLLEPAAFAGKVDPEPRTTIGLCGEHWDRYCKE